MDNVYERKVNFAGFPIYIKGINQAGYRGPKRYVQGIIAFNNVSWQRWVMTNTTNSSSGSVSTTSFYAEKVIPPYINTVRAALEPVVTQKYLSRVDQLNAMLGVMFAERQKTIDMISDYVVRLAKVVKNFRKMAFESATRYLQKDYRRMHRHFRDMRKRNAIQIINNNAATGTSYMSSKWLEYRYGWLPLVMDVEKLLTEPLEVPKEIVYASASSDVTIDRSTASKVDILGGVCKVRFIGHYRLASDTWTYGLKQYGLASWGLAQTAWELIPFSFMVNWFVGVGDLLQYKASAKLLKCIQFMSSVSWSVNSNSATTTGTLRAISHFEHSGGVRTVGSVPTPKLIRMNLDTTRCLDAIALLRQCIIGKKW